MLQNIFLVFYFFDKSRPASERHLQETEGRGRGQTMRNTVCAFPSSSLWTGRLRGRSGDYLFVALLLVVAVNVPVDAVALRVSVVWNSFSGTASCFWPHLPHSVFLDFFVGEVILNPLSPLSAILSALHIPLFTRQRSLAVYGVLIIELRYPSSTPPLHLP